MLPQTHWVNPRLIHPGDHIKYSKFGYQKKIIFFVCLFVGCEKKCTVSLHKGFLSFLEPNTIWAKTAAQDHVQNLQLISMRSLFRNQSDWDSRHVFSSSGDYLCDSFSIVFERTLHLSFLSSKNNIF